MSVRCRVWKAYGEMPWWVAECHRCERLGWRKTHPAAFVLALQHSAACVDLPLPDPGVPSSWLMRHVPEGAR